MEPLTCPCFATWPVGRVAVLPGRRSEDPGPVAPLAPLARPAVLAPLARVSVEGRAAAAEPLPAGEDFPLPVPVARGSGERRSTGAGFPPARATRVTVEEARCSGERRVPASSRATEVSRDTAPRSWDREEPARTPTAPERSQLEEDGLFLLLEERAFFFFGLRASEEEEEAPEDEDEDDDEEEDDTRDLFFFFFFRRDFFKTSAKTKMESGAVETTGAGGGATAGGGTITGAAGGNTDGKHGGWDCTGHVVAHDGVVDTTVDTAVVVIVGIADPQRADRCAITTCHDGSPGRPRDGHTSPRPGGA